jgi:hypothetical protein
MPARVFLLTIRDEVHVLKVAGGLDVVPEDVTELYADLGVPVECRLVAALENKQTLVGAGPDVGDPPAGATPGSFGWLDRNCVARAGPPPPESGRRPAALDGYEPALAGTGLAGGLAGTGLEAFLFGPPAATLAASLPVGDDRSDLRPIPAAAPVAAAPGTGAGAGAGETVLVAYHAASKLTAVRRCDADVGLAVGGLPGVEVLARAALDADTAAYLETALHKTYWGGTPVDVLRAWISGAAARPRPPRDPLAGRIEAFLANCTLTDGVSTPVTAAESLLLDSPMYDRLSPADERRAVARLHEVLRDRGVKARNGAFRGLALWGAGRGRGLA